MNEKEKKCVKVGYIFGKLEIFFIKLHWKVCNKQKKKDTTFSPGKYILGL